MVDPSPERAWLAELVVADSPEAWAAAGFSVGPGDTVRLGNTALRLIGRLDSGQGITGWTVGGVIVPDGHLDGLSTTVVEPASPVDRDESGAASGAPAHPNGATGIDHVVVSTPDLERTVAACESAGLRCRRIRDAGTPGHPMRQAFLRLGPVVLEVVGGATGRGTTAEQDPARWFGLAVDVTDLDDAAALLGDGLSPIKAAVQAGRRIATVRHRDLGLSVAVALMDDRGDR